MNGWGRLAITKYDKSEEPIGDPQCTFGWWKNSKMHGNSQTFQGKHLHLKIDSGWYDDDKFTGPHRPNDNEYRFLEFDEETLMV